MNYIYYCIENVFKIVSSALLLMTHRAESFSFYCSFFLVPKYPNSVTAIEWGPFLAGPFLLFKVDYFRFKKIEG